MTAPRLALTVTQRLHVGMEIRKALTFLQLPGVELEAAVRREILENPCLEIDPDGEIREPEPITRRRGDRVFEGYARAGEPLEGWMEREIPAPPDDLGSHLRRQIALRVGLDPRIRRVADYWVGCLDDRGYVGVSPEDVAGELGIAPGEAAEGWSVLRSLDPPGVGASGLQDALRLQLSRRCPGEETARRLVEEAWEFLPRGVARVARALQVSGEEVTRAIEVLSRLSPRPGHEFDPEPVRAIWPDVLVREVDGRYLVAIEESSQPRLRWSPSVSRLPSSDPELASFLGEKRRSARWLLRALQRRRRTLVRVTEAIVASQEEFFRRGPRALRPLTLRDVAGVVGLHESTVARVTQDKYADTPRGVLSLRYFFSGRVRKSGEEDTAAKAVQERVREIIRKETGDRPISDQRIAELLEYEGIRIARRTVAKYRDQMGIPRAQLRGLAVPAA